MAGTARLEGRVLKQTLMLLDNVADVFAEHNIPFALDGGTALGVVREGRLLPWDTDVDIAVDFSHLPKLKKATVKLFLKGYRIRYRQVSADIGPFRKGEVRLIKIWRRKFGFLKGEALVDVFLRKTQDGQAYWLLGSDHLTLNAMPETFHREVTSVSFNDRMFSVPAATDEFLTYRYGDWKTPVKEWDAAAQDGAIAVRR